MIYTKYTCPRCRKDFSYSKQPSHKVTIPDWEGNEFKYELCDECFNQLFKWLHFGYDIKDKPTNSISNQLDIDSIDNVVIPDTFYISQMQEDIEELKQKVILLQDMINKDTTN